MNSLYLRAHEEELRQAWRLAEDIASLKAMGFWRIMLSFLYGYNVDTQPAIGCLRELLPYLRQQNRPWELANALCLLAGIFGVIWVQGELIVDPEEIRQLLLEALAIFQEVGDKSGSGYVLHYLGLIYLKQENYLEAIERWQAAQASLQEVGEWVLEADIFGELSGVYQLLGDFEAVFHNIRSEYQTVVDKGDKLRAAHALSRESFVALRYSNLNHARQTRQQSLALYQETGHALGAAWGAWEMGNINRLAGDLPAAREWFEKARPMLENVQKPLGLIFYYRGLGDIAEAAGDYSEAKKQFQESLRLAQDIGHLWSLTYALCGLGRAEIASGEVEAAQEHFRQALEIARRYYEEDMLPLCLAGFAVLYAATGNSEQAVELGSLVIHHKLSWNETKAQMAALLQSITSLPPERLAAAQEVGCSLEIEEAIRRLL